MFSRYILAAFAFASVALAASIDPAKCYTLSRDGVNYLDSTSSVLKIQNHPDRSELDRGNDKGVRFRFPTGEGGVVVCQAHNDHYVGKSGSSWRTDVNGNAGGRGSVHSAGNQVFIQADSDFIGSNAEVAGGAFNWDIAEISCAKL